MPCRNWFSPFRARLAKLGCKLSWFNFLKNPNQKNRFPPKNFLQIRFSPCSKAALIQLLKETHMSHDVKFVQSFLDRAFATNSNMECLLKNVSVLIEEVSASSANYDSGRNLLSKLVRNYLTNNIALILQFLTQKNVAMSRSALEVLSRLQFETGLFKALNYIRVKPVNHGSD